MIKYAEHGNTAVITLDRPAARNAINGEMAEAIEVAIDRVEADDRLWVLILAGTPPVFCAGADLKATRGGEGRSMFTRRGGFAGITTRVRTKPLIAAVDGAALAGGTEVVLACDLVVASPRSTFGIPEVKRSLVASGGGLFRLGRKIPINVAMELALTGEPITAQRGYALGLVNQVSDDALTAALDLSRRICDNAPLAVRESRSITLRATPADDDTAWQLSRDGLRRVMQTADYNEGLAAFVEKRHPQWQGR